jgi:hypothetical protein
MGERSAWFSDTGEAARSFADYSPNTFLNIIQPDLVLLEPFLRVGVALRPAHNRKLPSLLHDL